MFSLFPREKPMQSCCLQMAVVVYGFLGWDNTRPIPACILIRKSGLNFLHKIYMDSQQPLKEKR